MSLVNQSIIKHKMGLLHLAEELRNVSQACRVMGVSRDTFYRVKEAKESGGLEALLHKDRLCEALHDQDADRGGRSAERPRAAVLSGARRAVAARADGSRHRILRQGRAARISAIPRGERHRSHAHQGAVAADQRHLRALPQDDPERVLPGRLPQEDLRDARGAPERS
jgi:hypothetical protein